MHQTEWFLLDTETTGFKPPIYVVELAAQRMRGWAPDGPPFVRLLNHGVDIPPDAARVNGYTREILERDGELPLTVYDAFAAYTGNRPLVAYNLEYDLDQVLRPEWQRLGRAPISRAGFCALRLAQRLLYPAPSGNCKLQTLRQYYRLPVRGAHTAGGNVATVVDLLQQVLRPLAEARGLTSWAALCHYASEIWYPSRLAFGKYKGRDAQDARHDAELRAWLEWLANSSNSRSTEMGRWYLAQLAQPTASIIEKPATHPLKLDQLIEAAHIELVDLKVALAQVQRAIAAIQVQLFTRLRSYYARRDILQLTINYRRRYLDIALQEGIEAAEETTPAYEQACSETEREYANTAVVMNEQYVMYAEEEREMKTLFRQLNRLYYSDRFSHHLEQQATYERITQVINQVRQLDDIDIAQDANALLVRRGLDSETLFVQDGLDELNCGDETDADRQLQHLYENLQIRILALLEELSQLCASSDYELYQLTYEHPALLIQIADQQAEAIRAEIAALELTAQQLADESVI